LSGHLPLFFDCVSVQRRHALSIVTEPLEPPVLLLHSSLLPRVLSSLSKWPFFFFFFSSFSCLWLLTPVPSAGPPTPFPLSLCVYFGVATAPSFLRPPALLLSSQCLKAGLFPLSFPNLVLPSLGLPQMPLGGPRQLPVCMRLPPSFPVSNFTSQLPNPTALLLQLLSPYRFKAFLCSPLTPHA